MPRPDDHLDPDQLALLAMGEPVASRADSAHLVECATCAEELQELTRAVQVGRATIDVGEIETPDPVVWTRIAQELHLSAPSDEGADEKVAAGAVRRSRASRLRTFWSLAAAIALLAGIGLGGWALGQRSALVPVAEAALAPFPDHPGAEGSALVEQKRDGEQVVRVTLEASQTPDTYREVWLITADASALISLGVLDGTEGTFPIPAGVNLKDYVLVDISQEKIDGNPSHSGDSIVRGELRFDGRVV
ncbi:anti-sigma factor [Microbacterium rhizomatis]|uniref:Anti-sigma factor n=1 Tax=Microbacterium rhizomatis TaxID=1631477 RepID=A0A5J5J5Z2_9MICO|nr:anti-sigma factor [Microbacterium rhizomatis]KAA9110395.1 anti-sigma factor [Microbacterium rhizomatis]